MRARGVRPGRDAWDAHWTVGRARRPASTSLHPRDQRGAGQAPHGLCGVLRSIGRRHRRVCLPIAHFIPAVPRDRLRTRAVALPCGACPCETQGRGAAYDVRVQHPSIGRRPRAPPAVCACPCETQGATCSSDGLVAAFPPLCLRPRRAGGHARSRLRACLELRCLPLLCSAFAFIVA